MVILRACLVATVAAAWFYGTDAWVVTAALVTGLLLGMVAMRAIEVFRASGPQRHEHQWGPWGDVREVRAQTGFDATTALVQSRRCTDVLCKEVDTKDVTIVRSKGR